jgi:arylformamidase
MIIQLSFNQKNYSADLADPLDISIPIQEGDQNPNCYWADPIKFETIVSGNFIGSVKAGGSVNYQKLTITPHGNGTHTECFGHISSDATATINKNLTQFHFIAEVISVVPEKLSNGDSVITLRSVKKK